jgi:hypothetical protein
MRKDSILQGAVVLCYALTVVWGIMQDRKALPERSLAVEESDSLIVRTDTLTFDTDLLLNEGPKLKLVSADTMVRHKRYGSARMVTQDESEEIGVDLMLRTDLIAEFISRFNGDSATVEKFEGKLDFTAKGSLSLREGLILTLTNYTEAYKDSTLRRFARDIVEQQLKIDNWNGSNYVPVVTIAYTDGTGSIFPVRLTLRQSVANEAPVWYITQAESPYFTFGDEKKPFYIDFYESEFGFMGLSRHTDRAAFSVAGPDFKGDALSAYLLLVSKGFIHYHHSEKTQFVFRLGEYQLLAEHVESFEHRRSGYLITRIMKGKRLIFENR